MPTIDLNRLVIRKRYFVPLKPSELEKAITDELDACDSPIHGVRGWEVNERHKNILVFNYSARHSALSTSPQPITEKNVIEINKKFDADITKETHEELRKLNAGKPLWLYVQIVRTENNGCIVEAELIPALHFQIYYHQFKPEEYEIQSAYFYCEKVMKIIFESGLLATTVSEEKPQIPKPPMEFLMNDTDTRQITERLEKMLAEATNEILIMAWIGTFFINKLRELKRKGISIFVITGNVKDIRQDPMRIEKTKAFRELLSIIGKTNVSKNIEFHGRLVVVDNKALIGSADLDSYSLTGTRTELAAYTEDPAIVLSLRNYFKRTFSPLKETPQ